MTVRTKTILYCLIIAILIIGSLYFISWDFDHKTIQISIFKSRHFFKFDFINQSIYRMFFLTVVLVVFTVALWFIPKWQTAPLRTKETDDMRLAELENSFRKTLAQILGGILLLSGLIATWNTIELSQKTFELTQKRTIAERFSSAVEKLSAINKNGEPIIETRMAGIYSLDQIAEESYEFKSPILNLFAFYVRNNTQMDKNPQHIIAIAQKPREDIQTILNIFSRQGKAFQH